MHLGYHGGKCCGIKVIYGFGANPDDEVMEDALDAIPITHADSMGHTVRSSDRFFHESAPRETALQRLDRYISYIKERRPEHIIEVVLAKGHFIDQSKWFPVLEEKGFKKVNSCKNSNSGNTVHVFHLNIGE